MRLLQGVGTGGSFSIFHVKNVINGFSTVTYINFTDYSCVELTYQNIRSTLFTYWELFLIDQYLWGITPLAPRLKKPAPVAT